jgi:predicted ester cyclase
MTNAQLVREILQHSDQGDSARFRSLLAEDCEWVNPVVQATGADEITQNVAQNRALYRRWFTDVVSRGDFAAAREMLAADYRLHFPGMPGPVDRDGHLRLVAMFRSGFPDWVETVEDVVAEGDRVVARVVGRGTHLGEFQGVRPTGRRVSATGIGIGRIADGQIVESWAAYDALGLLEQLQAQDRAIA